MGRRPIGRRIVAVLVAVASSVVVSVVPLSPVGAVGGAGQWHVFSDINVPAGIVKGPDGAMWFTNQGTGTISRMAANGSVTSYRNTNLRNPSQIVVGSDHAMWFVNQGYATTGSIGRITSTGAMTFVTSNVYMPVGLTSGPGGLLWFTNGGTPGSIGTIDPLTTPVTTQKFLDPAITSPESITTGPDGAVWFTNYFNSTIGRITVAGGVATVQSFPGASAPRGIVSTSGALWYVNQGNNTIGRITTTTHAVTSYPNVIGAMPGIPDGIVVGPDQQIWYTGGVKLGRMDTTTHAVTPIAASSAGRPACASPSSIARGGASTIWYACGGNLNLVLGHMDSMARDPVTSIGLNSPNSFTVGPDGNTWYVNGKGSIGKITPLGAITNYYDARIQNPVTLVRLGSALWFTDGGGTVTNGSIGRITTSGAVTMWTDSTKILRPGGLAVGPERPYPNLWYTGSNLIGSFNPLTDAATRYPNPAGDASNIVASPTDSALWFTNPQASSIGRITTGGTLLSPPITASTIAAPYGIAIGNDHLSVWFTNHNSTIGSINTTNHAYTPHTNALVFSPSAIAEGPDDAMWFNRGDNSTTIYRMTPTGSTSAFPCCNGQSSGTRGMTWGSDGAMWYGIGGGSIGRMTTQVTPQINTLSPNSGPVGTQVTITGINLSGATKVAFNGKSAAIVSDTATQIVTHVPTGATTGRITVTVPAGTATSKQTFTVT